MSSLSELRKRPTRLSLRRPTGFGTISVTTAVLFALILGLPMVVMLSTALFPEGGSFADLWRRTMAGRGLGDAALNTLICVVVVNVIAVPLGTFFAWLNERTDVHLGWLSTTLPVIPMLLPPVALSIGWIFLGDPGAGFLVRPLQDLLTFIGLGDYAQDVGLQSWPGLIFLYVLFVVPAVYVVTAAAFRNVDPSLEEAARVYGRGPISTFFRVSLPSIKPALGSAVLLVTIAVAELFSIPQIVGTPAQITVMSTYIARLVRGQSPPATDQAALLGVIVALGLLAIWLIQRRVANAGSRYSTIGGVSATPNRIAMGWRKYPARVFLIGYILLTSLLPLLAMLVVSLQAFWTPKINWADLEFSRLWASMSRPDSSEAILNSVILAAATATTCVIAALVLTVYARQVKGPVSTAIGVLTKLPSAISVLFLALGAILVFGGYPLYLGGTLQILWLVFVVSRMTQVSVAVESAVSQVGDQVIEAAAVSGAKRTTIFRRILLPLTLPGAMAGWTLAFALVIGDLTASVILAGPQNITIGYRIYEIYQFGTYSELAALAVFIVLVSATAVLIALRLGSPRRGRGPRAAAVVDSHRRGVKNG